MIIYSKIIIIIIIIIILLISKWKLVKVKLNQKLRTYYKELIRPSWASYGPQGP